MKDKLVIEIAGNLLAMDTGSVTGIIEADRLSRVPGAGEPVKGMVSLRNEPVTVVDLGLAFGLRPSAPSPHRIIINDSAEHRIGLDIGDAGVFFLWHEELKAARPVPDAGRLSAGAFELKGKTFRLIDTTAIFKEAERSLGIGGQERGGANG